ncbi:MAG: cobalamin-binding protein [Candidatus Omnitrophota bacterium]
MKYSNIKSQILIISSFIILASNNLFAKEMRIISITPATTEIACALGLTDNLVGVSTTCDYPPEVKAKEKIGSFSEPSIEKIISLKPDLVLATGLEQAQMAARLRALNVNVLLVDPGSFKDLFDSIADIGRVAGRDKEADDLIKKMRNDIRDVCGRVDSLRLLRKPKVYMEIWHDPIMAAGKGSFIDEMISLAGGENIAYDTQRPFSRFSAEVVVERDPDVIILGYMNESLSAPQMIAKRLGWANIKAVRDGRVYDDIDSSLLFRAGPRLVIGLKELYERFYP